MLRRGVTPPPRHWLLEELSGLGRLALPIALAQAGQSLMGLVDTAVVGRAGAAPLAAVGLGNAAFFSFSVLGIGLMMGLDPLVSQAVGAGDGARARRLLWQGGWLALGASAALALPMALVPAALEPLGIDAAVAADAARFVWWRLPGLPFLLLFIVGRSYLQAYGRTRPMLVAVVAANLANLPAAVLLVFGGAALPAWTGPLRLVPAMGAGGAALATSIVTVLQAAILALSVRGEAGTDRAPDPTRRRPSRADLSLAARLGLPVGLHMAAEVGVFALAGFLAARLGPVPLAAHQIALTYGSFTFNAAVGIGNAGSVRVGWAVGARDPARARRSGLAAFGAGAAFMSLGAIAFLLFARPLARLMTDQPEVVAAAAPLLAVVALFEISDGVQGVGAGVLRGAGDTRFTFVANLIGHYLVGLPVAVLLGMVLGGGVVGLWWGLCAGLTAVAVALLLRFWRLSRREISPVEARPGA